VAEITVTAGASRGGDATFEVEVRDGAVTTSHTVTLPPRLGAELGWTGERAVELIEASFEFLLEREPATSILRRFNLDVIGDYFPDYASEMARRAGAGG
jgi:hypothetical protein